jgi:predicted PurR-regulated permease PerM
MQFKIKNTNPIIAYSIAAVIAVAAYFLFLNFSNILNAISWAISVIQPFFFGFVIAYILNIPMSFLEDKIFNKLIKGENRARLRRTLSILLTYIVVAFLLFLLFALLLPQLIENMESISKKIPEHIYNLRKFLNNSLINFNISTEQINQIIPPMDQIAQTVSASYSWLFNFLKQIISGLATTIISIVLSIYFLIDKEKFIVQAKKILYILFSKEKTAKIIDIMRLTHTTFIKYISGISIDALVIAILFFIGMLFIYRPYALLFAVIVGFTNMIPYFGPFIGAFINSFLLLITSPDKIIWFLIFFILLQQIDANIISPRIIGGSIGLPVHWIIFAILIGGGLFGFIGMLVGIPIFAVIYLLLTTFLNEKYNKKLKEKKD